MALASVTAMFLPRSAGEKRDDAAQAALGNQERNREVTSTHRSPPATGPDQRDPCANRSAKTTDGV
jgi:hypothetical protein